jgi:predicted DNA-binding protein (UPF0251 family)
MHKTLANGYGRIMIRDDKDNPKTQPAHRVSWTMHYGPIPDGLIVCHSCDVNYPVGDITYRRCVRPDHLYLGTTADNMSHMAETGRAAQGQRHGAYLHPEKILRGEKSGYAKLTAEDVMKIRSLYIPGTVRQQDLADMFHVSQTTIWQVLTRQTWK